MLTKAAFATLLALVVVGFALGQTGFEALDLDLASEAVSPTLDLDPEGRPLVAWAEAEVPSDPLELLVFRIYARRWDGSVWQTLGGTLNVDADATASDPSLAVGHNGTPYLAWQECAVRAPDCSVHVKSWDGDRWHQLGGRLNTDPEADATAPVLRVDLAGRPVIVWTESSRGKPDLIYVKRWEGDAWQPLGDSLTTTTVGFVLGKSLTVSPGGALILAWAEQDADLRDTIFLSVWNGAVWSQPNPVVEGGEFPVVYATPANEVLLAWTYFFTDPLSESQYDSQVARWDGNRWGVLGEVIDVDRSRWSMTYAFALDPQGRPILGWHESEPDRQQGESLHLRRWNGEAWEQLSSALELRTPNDFSLDLAVSPAGELLRVWAASDGVSSNVYLDRIILDD